MMGQSNLNTSALSVVLIPLHDRLGHLLTGEGDLQYELLAAGHAWYLEPAARTHHANVSRFGSTIRQTLHRGRMLGALRASREQWPQWRRWGDAALFPLYPFAQLQFLAPVIRQQPCTLAMRARVMLLLGPVWLAGAIGKAWGVLAGAGNASLAQDNFELHRLRHISEQERREIVEFAHTMEPSADFGRRTA